MEMAVRTTKPLTTASVFCSLSCSFLRAKRDVFFVVVVVVVIIAVVKVGHVTFLQVPQD